MLEYYAYYPITKKRILPIVGGKKYISAADIKQQLSESMVDKLLPQPNKYCVSCLYVETNKTDVVKMLDDKWLKKGKLGKNREIEVTKDEIEKYDYYFIDLKNLELKTHVLYEFDRPKCSHETCTWGSRITSDIKIKEKIIGKYDFAKISEVWGMGVTFLISNRIKELFDENGITGLDYEICEIEPSTKSHQENISDDANSKYFVARVITSYKKMASDIKLRDHCKQHSITIDATPINVKYPVESMSQDDFQMLNKINVGKKEYTFTSPWFFISRRVLQMLLNINAKGIKSMTLFTKGGFTPVPFDD